MINPTTNLANDNEKSTRLERLKLQLHEKLIDEINYDILRTVDTDEVRDQLRRGAEQLCNLHSDLLTQAERDQLIDELVNETLGLGPLEPLMRDPTISDILINGPRCVYVERRGQLEPTKVTFRDLDHLIEIVQRIAGRVGRRVDESSPMVDARLADGSRLNAVIKPLALDGALVSIRRFSARPVTPGDLIARGAGTREMFDFLAACVYAGLNVVISGGTGAGKTTLLNVLSKFIPDEQRIATIEDAAELDLQQPQVARMETRPPNLEGKGEVTSRDLLKNALRMRPDRILVGECRGAEAFDMLQAMNTGHDGGLTTIHANNTRDALSRLEMLVGMAAPELPMWFIHRQIGTAINLVVQVERLPGGERKIVQISEVTGSKGEVISMHDLFTFQRTGVDENQRVVGAFHCQGIVPECLTRLQRAGFDLQPTLFEQRELTPERLDTLQGVL